MNNQIRQTLRPGKNFHYESRIHPKNEIWEGDYALFLLVFLASVFNAAGAAFETGPTAFFSLFDVIITSFSVVFHCLWFLPHIHVLLAPGYTLCPGTGI